MKNHNGDNMNIEIKKYHFNDLNNKLYDSDWLDAELIISNDSDIKKITLELLLVEELERIVVHLMELANNNYSKTKLEFIDPNLKLKLFTRSKTNVIKVLYYWGDRNIESWELIANKVNLIKLADEIRMLVVAYPCRCGFTHENLN
jgi:hypothetical protein